MTHETNLYAGWWAYGALVGLGVVLLFGSFGVWPGLIPLAAMLAAALYARRLGLTPARTLSAALSPEGLTLAGHRAQVEPGTEQFFGWEQITGVRLLPRPGYWQTAILTESDPETWLLAGHSLDLAEQIAEIAGLSYDETRKKPAGMGTEHFWG